MIGKIRLLFSNDWIFFFPRPVIFTAMKTENPCSAQPLPPPADSEKTVIQNTIWTHVAPFAAWLIMMSLLPPAGWSYAVRSAACLAAFCWFCPWRWYERLKARHLFPALVIVPGRWFGGF